MTTETSTNNNKYRICFSQNRHGHLFPACFPPSLETTSESFSMMTTMMLFALAHEKKPVCSLCYRSHFRSQFNSPHLHPPRELNLCSDFKKEDFPEVAIICGLGQRAVLSPRTNGPVHLPLLAVYLLNWEHEWLMTFRLNSFSLCCLQLL